MSRLEELRAQYDAKYGTDWDREFDLTDDESREWILACYDYYENECERKNVFGGPYTDDKEAWYGHPFEIVSQVSPDDPDYDRISLPLWNIRITDVTGEEPGVFAAYPEELFIDPAESRR